MTKMKINISKVRKENGLWDLPLRRYGRWAKVHKKKVHRY